MVKEKKINMGNNSQICALKCERHKSGRGEVRWYGRDVLDVGFGGIRLRPGSRCVDCFRLTRCVVPSGLHQRQNRKSERGQTN